MSPRRRANEPEDEYRQRCKEYYHMNKEKYKPNQKKAFQKWYYKSRSPEEYRKFLDDRAAKCREYRRRVKERRMNDPVFNEEYLKKQRQHDKHKREMMKTKEHIETFNTTTQYGLRRLKKGLPYKSRVIRQQEASERLESQKEFERRPVLNVNKKKVIINWD